MADDRHREAPAFPGLADHVSAGTRALSNSTCPNSFVIPFIICSGRCSMPGWCIGTANADSPCASHVGVGAREQDAPVRDVGVARPDLVAVDHELVAVARRGRAQRREVGAGVGLAETLAPPLASADQAGKETILDRVAAVRADALTRYPRLGRGGAPAAASSSSRITSKTVGRS